MSTPRSSARRSLLSCLSLLTCVARTGTLRSRAVLDDPMRVGWPIFGAVVDDVDLVVNGYPLCRGEHMRVLAFFSLPLDLVFDVALLPVDLVGAAFGARKHSTADRPEPEPTHGTP